MIVICWLWVDRSEELVGLLLTRISPSDRDPLRAEIRILAYQALIESFLPGVDRKGAG